jgi:hypothetical protein
MAAIRHVAVNIAPEMAWIGNDTPIDMLKYSVQKPGLFHLHIQVKFDTKV